MKELIVTVGPASIEKQCLIRLKEAGATSFRINLSHSSRKSLSYYFDSLLDAGITPAIDTQGAQIRVSSLGDKSTFALNDELLVHFGFSSFSSDCPFVEITHQEASQQLQIGDILKIDFGGLAVVLTHQLSDYSWSAKAIAPGQVIVNRAVDVVDKPLVLSSLTAVDKEAIEYSLSRGCCGYASFISSAEDIGHVRKYIGDDVRLISKIETRRGLSNCLDIVEQSDAILVDRGDLSREISISSVPIAVNSLIKVSNLYSTPVFIATNVLDSMMTNKLPSRAEISDIFSLIQQGADGLVLAAEVAIGKNPIASTALVNYLYRIYEPSRLGMFGIAKVEKPPASLVGSELISWI